MARAIPDAPYLRIRYWAELGKRLNLGHPATYNEKLQWLKLYNRHPEYTMMADKYGVRQYVADIIGEKYLVPLLGVWDRFDDIDFSDLPDQFVLKCTHDCGGQIICRDKSKLDLSAAAKIISRSMRRNYYYAAREWPYKNIVPRLIVEEYLDDRPINIHTDYMTYFLHAYKFFCFNGVPRFLVYTSDKGDDIRYNYFDMDFCRMDMSCGFAEAGYEIRRPGNFAEMIEIAAILSKGIPHVRVDLYNVSGKIYFNELTFFNWAGFQPFIPETWDETLGSWIELPEKPFKK
jgi:hypothetical protein